MSDLDAVWAVRKRGVLMEEAVPAGAGTMAAVLGLSAEQIEKVTGEIEGVTVANYNCPGQVVITGKADSVDASKEKLLECGAKRVLPLNVSGPFHSPMLKEAGEKLSEVLDGINDKCDGRTGHRYLQDKRAAHGAGGGICPMAAEYGADDRRRCGYLY